MILQPLPVLNGWSNGLLPERESILSSLTYSPPDADHHPLRCLCHLYTIPIFFLFYSDLASFSNFSSGGSKSPFLEGLSYSGIAPRFLGPLISRIAAHITSWNMAHFRSPFLSSGLLRHQHGPPSLSRNVEGPPHKSFHANSHQLLWALLASSSAAW